MTRLVFLVAFCTFPFGTGVSAHAQRLAAIDDEVAEALQKNRMPGCVVLIGRSEKVVFEKAYGNRQVKPEVEAMTVDTVFDLASLTKPLATATSVMLLAERGEVELDAPASKYVEEFTGAGKEKITIRELLVHTSGLTPDNHLREYQNGPEQAWRRICELELLSPPGGRFRYSDVGFIVLGKLVERVSGQPLPEFADKNIYQPLGMRETGFLPARRLRDRAAPTQQRNGQWMRGEVHDPRAWALGGAAGHAGLFSTARDLARYAQMLLDDGKVGDQQIMKPATVHAMTGAYKVSGGLRGLGWDKQSGYSSNRGAGMSAAAFGHGGFTGTAIWIDPQLDLYVIFLSNRVHPDGKGAVNRLAGKIGTIAVEALNEQSPHPE